MSIINLAQLLKLKKKKADKDNVLEKDNVTPFTPTDDWQPATKKYIDDRFIDLDSDLSLLGASQLEKVDEGGKSGWRLLGRIADFFGNIGQEAIDLSFSTDSDGLNGATGDYSFAAGEGTRADAEHKFVTGKFNNPKINSILEVGIGTDNQNRSNAIEVYKDGSVLAPNFTVEQQFQSEHSLVTKGYIDVLVVDGKTF